MRKFLTIMTLALIPGFTVFSASANGLDLALHRLAVMNSGCRAELSLHNDWRRDVVHFSIDLYILDGNGEALERQILDIAPLPGGQVTKVQLPLSTPCGAIGEIHIVAIPNCRLAGEEQQRDCLANLRVRDNPRVPVTIRAKH